MLSDRLKLLDGLKKKLNGYGCSMLTGKRRETPGQIILATYKCACEGLDVKGLDTLIMATPRTDVKQAIGRIMRARKNKPLVIDIVDTSSKTMKGWAMRKKRFARRHGLKVKEVNYCD